MPRTLNATLEAALDSGSFQAYFLITVREVGFSVIETATPLKFKLSGIKMEAKWKRLNGSVYSGFSNLHDLEFKLTRGVTIAGANYTIDSSYYYGTSQTWDGTFQTITACMLPDQKYSAAGDVSYKTVIDALCANFGKTATYHYLGGAWQSYKFLATGKILKLNRSNLILNMLKQKYLVYACDNGNNEILFKAIGTDQDGSTSHTLAIGLIDEIGYDVSEKRRFLSRDETATVHYTGNADDPLWNLGYLESTANAPSQTYSFAFSLQPIAPHLKYLSFDKFAFTFENYPSSNITGDSRILEVTEIFDYESNKIPWSISLNSYNWAKGTEGGSLPGTIEQAAPYTPLNVTNFANVLSSTDNNIQAAMETLDDHDHSGLATTEGIQDIIGAMVSSNTEAGIAVTYDDANGKLDFDAQTAGDARYAPIAKGVTNGDSHNHVGGDGAALTYVQTLPVHGLNGTPAAGSTNYLPPYYYGVNAIIYNFVTSVGGTLKNLRIVTNTAQPGTGSLVFTVMKENAATAIVITVAAGAAAGAYTDASNTVSVVAGDRISVRVVNNASGASAQIGAGSLQLEINTG